MTYTVSLDNFAGPMDLLLYLIKQEEVAIHDIRISTICDRYFEYMKSLKTLDVDLASEFLVMASTLMLIKSRSLLPIEEEVDLDEELDPEDELIQQLLEYKKFKIASRDLQEMASERALIYPYLPPKLRRDEEEIELDDVDLMDLLKAFAALMNATGLDRRPRLIADERPLREYIEDVFRILLAKKTVSFRGLFEDQTQREDIIGRFLALLELSRRGRIQTVQIGSFDDIEISLVDERELTSEEIELMEAELSAPIEEIGSVEIDAEPELDADDEKDGMGAVEPSHLDETPPARETEWPGVASEVP